MADSPYVRRQPYRAPHGRWGDTLPAEEGTLDWISLHPTPKPWATRPDHNRTPRRENPKLWSSPVYSNMRFVRLYRRHSISAWEEVDLLHRAMDSAAEGDFDELDFLVAKSISPIALGIGLTRRK